MNINRLLLAIMNGVVWMSLLFYYFWINKKDTPAKEFFAGDTLIKTTLILSIILFFIYFIFNIYKSIKETKKGKN